MVTFGGDTNQAFVNAPNGSVTVPFQASGTNITVVGACMWTRGVADTTTATYGSSNMNLLTNVGAASAQQSQLAVFSLHGTRTDVTNFVMSGVVSNSEDGVAWVGYFNGTATNTTVIGMLSNADVISVSLQTNAAETDEFIVDFLSRRISGSGGTQPTQNAGQTQRVNRLGGASQEYGCVSTEPGATTNTVGWSWTNVEDAAYAAVIVTAAAPAASTNLLSGIG
jgi:hypothetical protein